MYEDIVNEYLDMPLPTRIDRDDGGLTLPRPAPHNPVWSIVGVRRCGKTNMLYQLMDGLIKRGVPRELMLYVDFDDDRLDTDSRTCANDALEAYYELVPEARQGCYLFLDEIQEAQGWQTFVRRVSEHYSVTIVPLWLILQAALHRHPHRASRPVAQSHDVAAGVLGVLQVP